MSATTKQGSKKSSKPQKEATTRQRSKKSSKPQKEDLPKRPNILMIMVDQMRFPRFGYGSEHGFLDPLKQIFGFQGEADEDNEFKEFFPGLWALRDNSLVLNNHRTASSACVPSRGAIFSGQYGTVTGVLYTDGCLKEGTNESYPWLNPDLYPTIGDWMKEAGYTTHYFGKWHVSGETTSNLEGYGFSDWDLSYPDPYGGSPNNLGYYRDYQFSALVRTFLLNQGLGVPLNVAMAAKHAQEAEEGAANTTAAAKDDESTSIEDAVAPWFTVCSFNNPHDIGLYSAVPKDVCDKHVPGMPYALRVPPEGTSANLPRMGTMTLELNPLGFPQENAQLPPTWNEELKNKPTCQLETAYKVGIALMSNGGQSAAAAAHANGQGKKQQLDAAADTTLDIDQWGMPLALSADQEKACLAFLQYYGYLMHEVDQHISAVLDTLEKTGQADNTIVIFTADHGENGAAHHMMMEKFHSAYEETIHVPMVVRFPRTMLEVDGVMKQVDTVTSHIDILPTVLGLAGVGVEQRQRIQEELTRSHPETHEPVGADLSDHLKAKGAGDDSSTVMDPVTGSEREGVLFMTHDAISEPLPGDDGRSGEGEVITTAESYGAAVLELIRRAEAGEDGTPPEAASLVPGPIRHPSLIHSVVSQDGWKLVRYFENMAKLDQDNQYELYDLNTDPNEVHNLLIFDGSFPTIAPIPPSQSLTEDQLSSKAREMMDLLVQLEDGMLKRNVAEPQ